MLRILRHALRKHVRVQLMEQEGNSLSFLVAIDVSSIWLSLNASCVFLFGQEKGRKEERRKKGRKVKKRETKE